MPTSRRSPILAALLLFASILGPTWAGTIVLQPHVFYDQGTTGMVASHTILVPQGWQATGKAYWAGRNYYNVAPSQDIRLTSPSGIIVHIGPSLNATDYRLNQNAVQQGYTRSEELTSDDGKIRLNRPESFQGWAALHTRLAESEPEISNVHVDEVFEITDLSTAIQRVLQPERQRIQATGATYAQMNIRQDCDGFGIGLHSTFSRNGTAYESFRVLVVTTVYTHSNLGLRLDWNINLDVTFAAPQGNLESVLPELVAIASSAREVPNWSRLKAEHLATMRGIQLDGFAKRSRILADAHAEVTRIQHETYRRTSAISDRSHRNYINAIREVEIYSQGGYSYELPAGYNHVYGDGNGGFILTDNALLNPNADIGGSSWWSPVSPR